MLSRREYIAALAEAKTLSDVDKNDLTKEQAVRRKELYEQIAEYEKRNKR